jgi:hypothetical protein
METLLKNNPHRICPISKKAYTDIVLAFGKMTG